MSQSDAVKLGQKIREARLERGLTQEELAAGRFSKTYISAVEIGRIHASVEALSYIAARLDLPLSSLLGEESDELREQRNLLNLAAARYYLLCGEYGAARTSLDQLERSTLYGPPRVQLRLLEVELCLAEDDPIEAQRLLTTMRTEQRRPPPPSLAAYADYLSARAYLMLGQLTAAVGMASRALTTLHEAQISDLHLELATLITMMQAQAEANPAAALALQPQIEILSEQASDVAGTASQHYRMALNERLAGRQAEAQQHLHYAAGLAELGANCIAAQAAATNLATLYLAAGDDETAARYLAAALRYARANRQPAEIAAAAARLASFLLNAAQLSEAE